jgi:hypothetical protein
MAPTGEVYAVIGSMPSPILPLDFTPIDLTEAKVGRGMYVLHLNVQGMTREKAYSVLEKLKEGVEGVGARLLYAIADSNSIKMVIHGSPFSWAALLALLPMLLALAGMILLGVGAWQAITAIPSWVWAALIIGGALLILGPPIGEFILGYIEKARRE